MNVAHIMNAEFIAVREEMTVREVFIFMKQRGLRTFPVVDDNYHYKGILSEDDLLGSIYFDYKQMDGEMPTFKEIQDSVYPILNEPISKIIKTHVQPVEADLPVIQVGARLLVQKADEIPVVKNKKVVGMVTPARVFVEIMDQFVNNETVESTPRPEPKRDFTGKENRLFKRVDFKTNVAYQVMKSGGSGTDAEWKYTTSSNLSAGGILVNTDEELKAGAMIDLVFRIKDGQEPMHTLGRVQRMVQGPDKKSRRVGIMFLTISSTDRTHIETALEEGKA